MYINLPTNKIESFQYFPFFWEYVSALNSKLLVLKNHFIYCLLITAYVFILITQILGNLFVRSEAKTKTRVSNVTGVSDKAERIATILRQILLLRKSSPNGKPVLFLHWDNVQCCVG